MIGQLPKVFDNFFELVSKRHDHNTRFASRLNFSLPKVRTNYGKFNIRFAGAKAWNSVDEKIKKASSIKKFKQLLKDSIIESYKN